MPAGVDGATGCTPPAVSLIYGLAICKHRVKKNAFEKVAFPKAFVIFKAALFELIHIFYQVKEVFQCIFFSFRNIDGQVSGDITIFHSCRGEVYISGAG